MKVVEGNVLDYPEILHEVNTLGIMGAGVAKQIKKRWPIVDRQYRAYINKIENEKANTDYYVASPNHACLMGEVCRVDVPDGPIVWNLFAQSDVRKVVPEICDSMYGPIEIPESRMLDYEAFYKGLEKIRKYRNSYQKIDYDIAVPMGIGCGLAGGSWKIVEAMLDDVFGDRVFAVKLILKK